MDKTYQLGPDSKSYLISPWTTEEVSDEETCFEIDGPVQPQSILPANVSAFQVETGLLTAFRFVYIATKAR